MLGLAPSTISTLIGLGVLFGILGFCRQALSFFVTIGLIIIAAFILYEMKTGVQLLNIPQLLGLLWNKLIQLAYGIEGMLPKLADAVNDLAGNI